MNTSFVCEENIQKAQLLLLGKLVTKTVVGNLSEEAVGITSKDVWVQNSTCMQQLRAFL